MIKTGINLSSKTKEYIKKNIEEAKRNNKPLNFKKELPLDKGRPFIKYFPYLMDINGMKYNLALLYCYLLNEVKIELIKYGNNKSIDSIQLQYNRKSAKEHLGNGYGNNNTFPKMLQALEEMGLISISHEFSNSWYYRCLLDPESGIGEEWIEAYMKEEYLSEEDLQYLNKVFDFKNKNQNVEIKETKKKESKKTKKVINREDDKNQKENNKPTEKMSYEEMIKCIQENDEQRYINKGKTVENFYPNGFVDGNDILDIEDIEDIEEEDGNIENIEW